MSRKSRTLKKALAQRSVGGSPVSRLRGPGDVAVMVPYLLGFQPVESLVLVGLAGPRKRFGPVLRIDLADGDNLCDEQAELVTSVMVDNGVARVVVVAFSDFPDSADPVVERVMARLDDRQVEVEDAFRADGRRWWSYVCANPRCCSPDGVPYDAGASRVAAEAVLAGLSCAPDRDALRAELAPDEPARRAEVRAAVVGQRRAGGAAGPPPERVDDEVEAALASRGDLTAARVALLALAVQSPVGAERAARCVTRADAADHYELWRTVTRRVDDELLPAVGCLAAFSAWLDGRGVLAWHAVERVLQVAPDHPFAQVVVGLLDQAVNPARWFDGSGRLPDADGTASDRRG